MVDQPLRLLPFTNWSLVLNLTLNPIEQRNSQTARVGAGRHDNQNVIRHTPSWISEDGSCHVWQDPQHSLFQVANMCAAVSLLTPCSFRHHLLFLRSLLLVSYLLMVLWAGLLVCMLDVLVWNCVFIVLDVLHVFNLTYNTMPSHLDPQLSELFRKKLEPLRVTRQEFADLCSLGSVLPLRKSDRYARENFTPSGQKVSILLKGRLKVCHAGVFLHWIEPNEFLDSPEFDSCPPHLPDSTSKFQVSLVAVEDCLLMSWSRSVLKSYFSSHPFMAAVFNNIIGKDISDKLYKIQELLLKGSGERQSEFMSRNSSMVNVRRCLQSREDFVNGFSFDDTGSLGEDLNWEDLSTFREDPV